MLIVRPVRLEDLDDLYEISAHTKVGLTTFPHDREILQKKIEDSLNSFSKRPRRPSGETYFFVMEDTLENRLVGTCALFSKVGGFEPSYTYQIKTALNESKTLNVKKEIQYLKLKMDHNGPSEIGTLFLVPGYRRKGAGRLLSLSRFLLVAQYPQCFEPTVIAEMRGVLDEGNHSPFWNAVCQHFFVVDFEKADLMVMSDKSFIADLIPEHPIYIPILPKEAQEVIGRVHQDTEPALNLLKQEGFIFANEVDIFEAGPVYKANARDIRSVKESREVVIDEILNETSAGDIYLLANVSSFGSFRVIMGEVEMGHGLAKISKQQAEVLRVDQGDKLRVVKARGHDHAG